MGPVGQVPAVMNVHLCTEAAAVLGYARRGMSQGLDSKMKMASDNLSEQFKGNVHNG